LLKVPAGLFSSVWAETTLIHLHGSSLKRKSPWILSQKKIDDLHRALDAGAPRAGLLLTRRLQRPSWSSPLLLAACSRSSCVGACCPRASVVPPKSLKLSSVPGAAPRACIPNSVHRNRSSDGAAATGSRHLERQFSAARISGWAARLGSQHPSKALLQGSTCGCGAALSEWLLPSSHLMEQAVRFW
jgi:hypothetical protein